MDSPFAGVVYNGRDGSISHLYLEEVKVDALVVDVSARVTVQQVFSNLSPTASSRAKYVFPIPSRAAVCAFEMHSSEGKRILGIVKEKTQASMEHDEAIRQGKTTALVEWATDDIFTISLGSIPGEETITTILTYVMDLMDDDSLQQVRFQIPMCVGQRYGKLPEGMVDALGPTKQTRVRFNIHIQTKGLVRPQNVISPSHPRISVSSYHNHAGRPSRHRVSVKFRSRHFLDKDFVLRIQAAGLDRPRCFMERDSRGTVAMQLALIPHFDLPPVAAQEYLFLVDRSGSMSGLRIETAKQTLALLLRALPSQGTVFNIYSFGSYCDGLWPQGSEEYTQASLEHATKHVMPMSADYGGTELRAALDITLRSRILSRPTVLFVLTDGEVIDPSEIDLTIQLVADAVARSPTYASLRVFTLGIGSTVSSAMCEGIARAGNGVCLMTTTSEGIVGKCSKLLRAGRTFLLKNITIDWGISPVRQNTDVDGSPSVQFTAMDQVIRQAPSEIESIYPGFRLVVFVIIKTDHFVAPQEITLRAQRDGTGEILEFSIPVEQVKFNDDNIRNRLVHTLAARRLIMELDDPSLTRSLPEDERVTSIVRLGEQYQLASRYTSFVAVDGVEPESVSQRGPRRTRSGQLSDQSAEDTLDSSWDLQAAFDFAVGAVTAFLTTWFGPPPQNWRTQSEMPGGNVHSRPTSPFNHEEEYDGGDETDDTFTTLSSLDGDTSSDWSDFDSRPPSPPPDDPEFVRSPSPDFTLPQRAGQTAIAGQNETRAAPPPLDANVVQLVQLQSFDGSFLPSNELAGVVGQSALEEGRRLQLDDKLWATVLAVAYFQKHLIGQPDLLDSLVEKALEYVYQVQNTLPANMSIPQLLHEATPLV